MLIIDEVKRLFHVDKRSWLKFLDDGNLPFKPDQLHSLFKSIIKKDSSPKKDLLPRGNMLLRPRRRDEFTVDAQNKPCRPEEALERFITASNPDTSSRRYCNQFPIRGGKESCDIAILNDDTNHEFVELKAWRSDDSPLYAIVESLKNFYLYSKIRDYGIMHHMEFKYFNKANLIVLAPRYYYQLWLPQKSNFDSLRKALTAFSSEFDTYISLMELSLEEKEFNEKCKVCKIIKVTNGKKKVCVSTEDAIPELARDNWRLLVSSERS